MEVGETIRVRDGFQGELGAAGDPFAEARRKGMVGQQGGEECGGTKFRSRSDGGKRLSCDRCCEVEPELAQDGKIVARGIVRPLESESDRVGLHRREAENG